MVFHEITEPAIRAAAAEPARSRPGPRRRPGDPPHPGSPLRLRSHPCCGRRSCRGSRPAGCSRWRRGSSCSASASGCGSLRPVTGTSPRWTPGPTRRRAPSAPGSSPSTATGSPRARDFGPDGQLRGSGDSAAQVLDEGSARRLAEALHGRDLAVTSVESRPYTAQAVRAVHDLDVAAGGESRKLRFSAERHDALGPAAVRERLHHLHAHRLDSAVQVGDQRRRAQARELYGDAYVSPTPAVHAQGQERAGGARGRPARRGRLSAPRARWPARSTATTSGSTS